MGFIPDEELLPTQGGALMPSPSEMPATKKPTFGQVVGAAFGQGNTLASTGAFIDFSLDTAVMPDDPNYDPFTDLTGYEEEAPAFADSRSGAETARIKARIDAERRDRDILARAGPGGVVASVAAGIIDPVNLIPVGGWVSKGRAGLTIGARALEGATIATKSAAVSEGILYATQTERTPQESALNIAGAAVFGGLLGTASGIIKPSGEAAPISPELRSAFKDEWHGATNWVDAGGISAQSSRSMTGDQLRLAPAFGLERLEAANPISDNPMMRALTSPSTETARLVSELAETPLFLRGNADDVASPIAAESRIKGWSGPLADGLTDLDGQFVRYRFGREQRTGDMLSSGLQDMTGGTGKLSYRAFKEEVGRAMRRGDTSEIPEVAAAAKSLRRRIFDPLKEHAIRLGLLPEGVEVSTADSYLTRVYNIERIAAERNAFTDRLTDWFEREQIRVPGEDRLSRAELRGEAETVTTQILSGAPGRTGYDLVANLRGPLKERTLNVPDAVIEPWLENDVERVARTYTRTMAADVELARAFGRPDMLDQIEAIRASYERLFRRTPDGAEQAKLQARMERDLLDIQGMRDRIRGSYRLPDNPTGLAVRTMRSLRTLNYLRLLGGMTLSAIPDVGRTVLAAGGLGKLLTRGIGPLIASTRKFKLSAQEVKLAGTALDMVLDTRAQQMADVFEDFGRYSKFERGLQYAGEKYGVASLMSPWNAAIKQMTGVMAQTRMLQAIRAGAGANANEVRRLRMLGISPEMSDRIGSQFTEHGSAEGGVWWANSADWADGEAAAAYRAALVKEVDRIIVSPGQEKPLWISSEWGKTVGQFKSFTFSSMSRVLIAGLQERDAAVAQSMVLSASLGMLVYYLKSKTAGKEPSKNPMKWVVEGIDRSGMMGWIFEANNMIEKSTGGRIGVNPLIGEAPATRYASRGATEAILGPSVGLVDDAVKTSGALAAATIPGPDGAKPLTRGDINRARRLAPFQNLFYLKWLFDEVENGAGDALGLPAKEPAKAQ